MVPHRLPLLPLHITAILAFDHNFLAKALADGTLRTAELRSSTDLVTSTTTLEPCNFFSRCLQIGLENLDAIVAVDAFATSFRVVWICCLLAILALYFEILTLLHLVILHVPADNAETASK